MKATWRSCVAGLAAVTVLGLAAPALAVPALAAPASPARPASLADPVARAGITFPPVVNPDYGSSAIAWTGNSAVIAAVDSYGNLDFWWQNEGGTSWTEEVVASGISGGKPTIAWAGSSVVISAVDSQGNLDYWWQAAGTTPWHQERVASAGSGMVFGQPAIAWTGSSVVISAVDSQGNLDYWWQAAGTTPWNEQLVGTGMLSGSAIAWTGSSVVISAEDSQGNLDYWWQAAGTAPWHQEWVASVCSTYGCSDFPSTPAIAWTGSSVVITAADADQNVDYWWQAAGTTTWNQQQVGFANFLPGNTPAIAWTGSSVVITEWEIGGTLEYWWQAAGTTPWNEQDVADLGESSLDYGDSPSIAWTGSSVIISAVDSQGNLDYWWQAAGTTTWHQELVAAS